MYKTTNLFLGHSFGFVVHPARLLQNLVECCSDIVYHFQRLEKQTVCIVYHFQRLKKQTDDNVYHFRWLEK